MPEQQPPRAHKATSMQAQALQTIGKSERRIDLPPLEPETRSQKRFASVGPTPTKIRLVTTNGIGNRILSNATTKGDDTHDDDGFASLDGSWGGATG